MRSGPMLALPVMIASCAGKPAAPPPPPAPALPFYVGSGAGSEHGNYASHESGEMIAPDGSRCITYVWDRPIDAQYALRLRSASCPSKERPGLYVATELERTIIPRSASEVDKADE